MALTGAALRLALHGLHPACAEQRPTRQLGHRPRHPPFRPVLGGSIGTAAFGSLLLNTTSPNTALTAGPAAAAGTTADALRLAPRRQHDPSPPGETEKDTAKRALDDCQRQPRDAVAGPAGPTVECVTIQRMENGSIVVDALTAASVWMTLPTPFPEPDPLPPDPITPVEPKPLPPNPAPTDPEPAPPL